MPTIYDKFFFKKTTNIEGLLLIIHLYLIMKFFSNDLQMLTYQNHLHSYHYCQNNEVQNRIYMEEHQDVHKQLQVNIFQMLYSKSEIKNILKKDLLFRYISMIML